MVLAVPRRDGGFYLLIHLVRNQFGNAFGMTVGWHPSLVVPADLIPDPRGTYFYSGSHFMTKGRWLHVGDRPDLLAAYPADPEIYHQKSSNPDNPAIGIHGAAETADGRLRNITEAEFHAGPLARSDYRQIMMEEEVEEALSRRERE